MRKIATALCLSILIFVPVKPTSAQQTSTPSIGYTVQQAAAQAMWSAAVRWSAVQAPHHVSESQHHHTTAPRPTPSGSGVWYALADCESGGDWGIDTHNGYFGGLQEDIPFWHAYGNPAYSQPNFAPASEQIAAAIRARDSGRGYHPWPGCARQLGLI